MSSPPSFYDDSPACPSRVPTVSATVVDLTACDSEYEADIHEVVYLDGLYYVSLKEDNGDNPLLAGAAFTKGYTTYEKARLVSVANQIGGG